MHRIILRTPLGKETDHLNRNKLDNQRKNLRICTHRENARNRGILTSNTSGIKGVYWDKQKEKWRVLLHTGKKRISLGLFKTKAEAKVAYNTAAKKHFGNFAFLNN